MAIRERVKGCITMEKSAADVYKAMMKVFPEEKDFFEEMYHDELRHMSIFADGDLFEVFGEGEGQVLPPTAHSIDNATRFAKKLLEQITFRHMTLAEALQRALTLEEAIAETFLNEIPGQAESLSEDVRRVLDDLNFHKDKLRRFMVQKGFIKLS